jgi:hypothetical protein
MFPRPSRRFFLLVVYFCTLSSLQQLQAMRKILVTGANKGIGFALVRRLLSEYTDTFVYLGSRDISRGEAAIKSLIGESDSWAARLQFIHLEVDSISSGAILFVHNICFKVYLFSLSRFFFSISDFFLAGSAIR